jgi:hypothetical protein
VGSTDQHREEKEKCIFCSKNYTKSLAIYIQLWLVKKRWEKKKGGTSGTSFSNSHFLPGDMQRQLVPLSLLLVGIHVHPKTQT